MTQPRNRSETSKEEYLSLTAEGAMCGWRNVLVGRWLVVQKGLKLECIGGLPAEIGLDVESYEIGGALQVRIGRKRGAGQWVSSG